MVFEGNMTDVKVIVLRGVGNDIDETLNNILGQCQIQEIIIVLFQIGNWDIFLSMK